MPVHLFCMLHILRQIDTCEQEFNNWQELPLAKCLKRDRGVGCGQRYQTRPNWFRKRNHFFPVNKWRLKSVPFDKQVSDGNVSYHS